jgi:hypothetical protein
MPGHSRSKNGVASLAYVPGIHVFVAVQAKGVDGQDKCSTRGQSAFSRCAPYPIQNLTAKISASTSTAGLASANFPAISFASA